MEYLSIGEFARKFGVSTEFLKYYSKQKLFNPIYIDDRQYRYYGDFQASTLAGYYRMSRAGISLNEMKDLVENGSLADYIAVYRTHEASLKQEIRLHQETLTYMENFLTAASAIEQKESWYVVPMPDAFFGEASPELTDGPEGGPWWKKDDHLVTIWQQLLLGEDGPEAMKKGTYVRRWGELLTPEMAEPLSHFLKLTPVPAARTFLYYHRIPAIYDKNHQLIDEKIYDMSEPLSIVKQLGLTPRGDLYQQNLCETHEEDGIYVNMLTRIPLA